MRKKTSILLLSSMLLLSSCQNDRNEVIKDNFQTELSGYKITKVKDRSTVDLISNALKSKLLTERNINNIDYKSYDFDNMKETIDKENKVSYSIPNKNNANLVLGAYIEDGTVYFFITEITAEANKDIIKYSSLTRGSEFEIFIDNKTKVFSAVSNKTKELYPISSQSTNGGGCGQGTIDCMENVYIKQGWISVGLTVVSAFKPQMVVAVAAGCAISRCVLK